MQKVINVNLNGNAYQLDEDAYAALRAYLDQAEQALHDNPDKAEIMADLEQAIAEKCARFLGSQKSVVSATEIDQVIRDMGPVEGTTGDQAKADGNGDTAQKPRQPVTKRLYQIREGAMITGVCNGLAAYFDVDVTIVRIGFVVLTLVTKGAFVVVYGVMMLVVPYAETSEDRATARGVAFNAQEVVDRAKKLHSEITSKAWRRNWRHKNRELRREMRRNAMREPVRFGPYDIPGAFFGGLLTPVFAAVNGVLLALLGYAIYSLATQGNVSGWTIPAGMPFWVAIVILVIVYGVVTSPLSAARHATIAAYRYYPAFAVWSGVVWLGIVTWLVWFGSQHQPEIREFIQNMPAYWQNLSDALRDPGR